MKLLQRLLSCICLLVCFGVHGQIITTVAGNGMAGYSGDSGPAIAAKIKYPSFIAFDKNNNIYFAEGLNNVIRKVSSTGIISTVAGDGTVGYSGDNGPATLAQLNSPVCVATDTAGNLFISDEGNNRVRKIDAITGNISTVAGNGIVGYTGDSGSATTANLNYPIGIACDKLGNLFIADHANFRIRRVDALGIITTYAGSGINGFGGDNGPAIGASMNAPNGLACDNLGNLYVAENRIRKIDASTHIITSIAGDGSVGYGGDEGAATASQLSLPIAICSDVLGAIYIADQDNNRIRKVDNLGVIHTVVGTGVAGFGGDSGLAINASLHYPEGVALDSCGNLYITDNANNRIRKVALNPNCWPLAVDDAQQKKPVAIYPNPTTSTLHIDNLKAPATYTLYDITGRVVATSQLTTGPNEINTTHLSPGIYLLHLQHKDGTREVHKIVKE